MALTGKVAKFCQEYLKDYNPTRAAIAAGYSKRSSRSIGYENLIKPDINQPQHPWLKLNAAW